MTDICANCSLRPNAVGEPVYQNWKDDGTVLLLLDYPTVGDQQYRKVFTGMESRYSILLRTLTEAKMDPAALSFATTIRCVTKSKAISHENFQYCSQELVQELNDRGIRAVLCFGSAAARAVLDCGPDNIDNLRGRVHEIPGVPDAFAVVTYALTILSNQGCSSCGKSVYPYLVRKDIEMFKGELIKRGIVR